MIHELNTLRPGYQGRFENTEAHRRELIGLIIVGNRFLGELGYWHESSDIYFSAGTFHRDDCLREFDDAEHRGSPIIFKGPRLRDAQAIADRYIDQRAYPQPAFQSITFPITNSEIDNNDRDDLLAVFMGMPVDIRNLPSQISGGTFQGYVEGWSWSTRFNELFLTINVSPVEFSQVAMRWNTTPITERWNTLSPTLTWEYATIVS